MEEKIAHLEKALGLAQAISFVTRLVKQVIVGNEKYYYKSI